MAMRRLAVVAAVTLLSVSLLPVPAGANPAGTGAFPSLRPDLVAYYDFEHPMTGSPGFERDLGASGTPIELINGGTDMRVRDGATRRSRGSMQVMQVNPAVAGNDDWKAGVYAAGGVPSLGAFNGARQVSVLGWFKMTGTNPSPNSNTANPDDRFNAVGLAGVLSGGSDGHAVRALLEIIDVNGELRVVALGRRVDGASSRTFAASADWQTVLPQNEWVFLAATFNYDTGEMALYKNGRPVPGFYVLPGDPWEVKSTPGPHFSSPTDPRGIKIAGSFPQNTREGNPCNCRFDSLMFLNRELEWWEILGQYIVAARRFPS
jgi:hypothetical protein